MGQGQRYQIFKSLHYYDGGLIEDEWYITEYHSEIAKCEYFKSFHYFSTRLIEDE